MLATPIIAVHEPLEAALIVGIFVLSSVKATDNASNLECLLDMRASNRDPKVGWRGCRRSSLLPMSPANTSLPSHQPSSSFLPPRVRGRYIGEAMFA